jgi:hypothetical protein
MTGGCCTDSECGTGACVNRMCQDCPTGQIICQATGQCYDPATTCCTDADCVAEPCRSCVSGDCIPFAEYCESGDYCYNRMTGGCCIDDECGCGECVNRMCTSPECCHDSDCGACEFCDDGVCHGACSQHEECCNGECVDLGDCCKGFGDHCGLLTVADASGSLQLDCCDGLLCCEVKDGHVCAECCHDRDCGKDDVCRHGYCEFPHACKSDKECPKGTCCCKDGTCSSKCCNHPKPPKPPKPQPPAPVDKLPATGVKDGQDDSSAALGITLAAGAAALLGAKVLRQKPKETAEDA